MEWKSRKMSKKQLFYKVQYAILLFSDERSLLWRVFQIWLLRQQLG